MLRGLAETYGLDYDWHKFNSSLAIHADCFEWMGRIPKASIHAIVTDPPYGVKEYDFDQLDKRENGNGGIWRIPPSFDGSTRSPLPRFTALNGKDRKRLQRFFNEWAKLALRILYPGGHIFLASNVYLSQLVFTAVADAGLEFRGQIIRLVRTLRGGDRPKNAEEEFPYVCSMARGCYEPWGIFRKPFDRTVAECLREHQTGGLRRYPDGKPFCDIIESGRTPKAEREIFDHPSLKPQSLMRQLVYAALPLGEGIILDPFMGSGSTLAAAEAMGLCCIGVERYIDYFEASKKAVLSLASLQIPLENWEMSPTTSPSLKVTAQIPMKLEVE